MHTKEKPTFFKKDDSLFRYNCDMLVIGCALLLAGIHLNGINALYQTIVCCVSTVLSEYVAFKLVTKTNTLGDLHAFTLGLMISLLLPACAPLWLGALSGIFAVIAVKLPFGGARGTPFVPVCAAVCFVGLCFPQYMYTYASSASTGLFATQEGFAAGTTLLDLLASGKSVSLNTFGRIAVLSGSYPGAVGTTSMLMMLAVMLYLLIRRPKRLYASVGFVCACTAIAMLFPRVNSGIFSSAALELSAGSLMFVALLLVNDPVTSPKKPEKAVLYGALAGIICMLLRHVSKMEDTASFAVLLTNALWPVFSQGSEKPKKQKRPRLKRIKLQESEAAENA